MICYPPLFFMSTELSGHIVWEIPRMSLIASRDYVRRRCTKIKPRMVFDIIVIILCIVYSLRRTVFFMFFHSITYRIVMENVSCIGWTCKRTPTHALFSNKLCCLFYVRLHLYINTSSMYKTSQHCHPNVCVSKYRKYSCICSDHIAVKRFIFSLRHETLMTEQALRFTAFLSYRGRLPWNISHESSVKLKL